MSVDRAFRAALDHLRSAGDPMVLPSKVAKAVAQTLAVAGASLSVASRGLRVPLGASDDMSALAERLQFTIGAGPCMHAIDTGVVVSMPEGLLRQRWPALADAWTSETPFRSAVSQPLTTFSEMGAALNLFFVDPSPSDELNPVDVAMVATAVSDVLFRGVPPATVPHTRSVEQRLQVWLATGIVMSARHLSAVDALARLRAHAYGLGTTLDDVAARLIEQPDTVAALDD